MLFFLSSNFFNYYKCEYIVESVKLLFVISENAEFELWKNLRT